MLLIYALVSALVFPRLMALCPPSLPADLLVSSMATMGLGRLIAVVIRTDKDVPRRYVLMSVGVTLGLLLLVWITVSQAFSMVLGLAFVILPGLGVPFWVGLRSTQRRGISFGGWFALCLHALILCLFLAESVEATIEVALLFELPIIAALLCSAGSIQRFLRFRARKTQQVIWVCSLGTIVLLVIAPTRFEHTLPPHHFVPTGERSDIGLYEYPVRIEAPPGFENQPFTTACQQLSSGRFCSSWPIDLTETSGLGTRLSLHRTDLEPYFWPPQVECAGARFFETGNTAYVRCLSNGIYRTNVLTMPGVAPEHSEGSIQYLSERTRPCVPVSERFPVREICQSSRARHGRFGDLISLVANQPIAEELGVTDIQEISRATLRGHRVELWDQDGHKYVLSDNFVWGFVRRNPFAYGSLVLVALVLVACFVFCTKHKMDLRRLAKLPQLLIHRSGNDWTSSGGHVIPNRFQNKKRIDGRRTDPHTVDVPITLYLTTAITDLDYRSQQEPSVAAWGIGSPKTLIQSAKDRVSTFQILVFEFGVAAAIGAALYILSC